jgi:hypothetical protein
MQSERDTTFDTFFMDKLSAFVSYFWVTVVYGKPEIILYAEFTSNN